MEGSSGGAPGALKLFACLGALLLFGLEPLVGRLLLPAFGGGYHVWATCLMFFQGALLVGYLYCHLLAPRLGRWHLALLLLPLPLVAAFVWRGASGLTPDPGSPVLSLLAWLTVWIAVPFAALATTGVVAQSWLAASAGPGRDDPYQLYAASNAGSLVGLLGYPLLVEPLLGLSLQRTLWAALYVGYLILAWRVAPRGAATATPAVSSGEEPAGVALSPGLVAGWLLLAAAPSALLMAVTNVIAVDVGSAPFVWVVPLSIYLLSFVLVFGRRRWCPYVFRRYWPELFLVGIYFYAREGAITAVGLFHLLVLFVACLVGHARLHDLRPSPRHLTAFYLIVALGGWLGGVFVALIAPRAFSHLLEYPLSLLALAIGLVWGRRAELRAALRDEHKLQLAGSLLLVGLLAMRFGALYLSPKRSWTAERLRNDYGVYRVVDTRAHGVRRRTLYHGTTEHGFQVQDGVNRQRPVGYYHPRSGLGDVFGLRPLRPMRIGMVGLGSGVCAAYAKGGDTLTFYELDPDDEGLARRHFSYLDDAEARGVEVEVLPGDARLSISAGLSVPAEGFDLLLIDAFSSDAIPTHLLTREALSLFVEQLSPEGWLVFHISNRYYDLIPVLTRTSSALDLPHAAKARSLSEDQRDQTLENPTTYYAIRRAGQPLERLLGRPGWGVPARDGGAPWTDDYADLLGPLAGRAADRLGRWWSASSTDRR